MPSPQLITAVYEPGGVVPSPSVKETTGACTIGVPAVPVTG